MCAAAAGTALRKGENVTLSALADELGSIAVMLEWATAENRTIDADVSVLLLGDDGKVRSNDDLIFYNQPSGAGGAVRLRGKTSSVDEGHLAFTDVVDVDMDDVPDSVESVVLAASLDDAEGDSFGQFEYLRLRLLRGSDATELLRFDVLGASTETAFVLGEVYRRAGQWKFRAIGQGYDAGLGALVTKLGVEVDADEQGDAAVEEAPTAGENPPPSAVAITGMIAAGAADADAVGGGTDPAIGTAANSAMVQTGTTAVTIATVAAAEHRTQTVTTKKRVAARRLSASKMRSQGRQPADGVLDQVWQPARLFPIAGIGGPAEQERRVTSALLAVLTSVREFGRALTTRFGAPAGKVEAFTEVHFDLGDDPLRPDGLIRVTRGQRTWTALVEVKTGKGVLRTEQVEAYLGIAREQRFDAVITISNLIVAPDERHPSAIDGRKTRTVGVHHLSWADIRFRCQLLLENNAVADPTQEHILAEFLRYLDHPRSGAETFEDMGSHWVSVRDSVSLGTLLPTDKGLPPVAERFDQLAHYLCLYLGGMLGTEVIPYGGRRVDVAQRRLALGEELCRTGRMSATLRFPGTVGPVTVMADLRAGRVVCSVSIAAPGQGRPLTRVKWITKQLAAANGNLRVESFEQGARGAARAELLALVRQKPDVLVAGPAAEIRSFRIALSAPLGAKHGSGKGTFITSVLDTFERFYEEVVENLRPWRESGDATAATAATSSE